MQEVPSSDEPIPQAASPGKDTPPGKAHSVVEAALAEKQAAWEAKRQEIDQVTDALELGVDEGIKETVSLLTCWGCIPTSLVKAIWIMVYLPLG